MNSKKMLKDIKENRFTIIEYLEQVFDDFDISPFNEIDALILSQLCYLDFTGIVDDITQDSEWVTMQSLYKAENFSQMTLKTLTPSLNLKLLQCICASPRYREVSLNYFTNIFDKETQEQFCAITYKLSKNHKIIAYRGTDLTLTGWKEDFNMFFISPVPGQTSAVAYLQSVADKTSADLTLIGHSKGGNLAVYSNAFCEAQYHTRIKTVYNLDGPSFPNDILVHNDFIKEHNKTIKIVPEGSIIGIMFENDYPPTIIKSHNLGFLQHDPFSWKCNKKQFISSNDYSNYTKHLDVSLNKWIYELDVEQRKIFVETIFEIVSSLNIENLDELLSSALKERDKIKLAFNGIDEDTKNSIKETLKLFLKISLETQFGNNKKVNIVLSRMFS